MNNKKKIWIVLLVLLVFSVLRESGYVNLYYANSIFNDRMETNSYSEFYEFEGKEEQFNSERKNSDHKTQTNENAWSVGFQTTSRVNIFTDLKEQLAKDLKDTKQINVEVQGINLHGLYWLPVYKSGSCEYQFNFEAVGKKSRVYRGTAEGKIDFLISGISSTAEAKERLSKQIAKTLIENIKKDVK